MDRQEVCAIISTSDFRNGLVIELDGTLFRIVEFQHVKPGKGGAFVRTKLKNVETGAVVDRTFRAGEKFDEVVLEHRRMQYLYRDGENYVFMDLETYEQVPVGSEVIGEVTTYLVENQVTAGSSYDSRRADFIVDVREASTGSTSGTLIATSRQTISLEIR